MSGTANISKMAFLDTVEKRHSFFNFTCAGFEPSNYVCWACIQQYKEQPNKRKMIFIDKHFTHDTPVVGSAGTVSMNMDDGYKVLKFVNIGADQIAKYSKHIGNQVGAAKATKTFADKRAYFGGGVGGAFKALLVKGISENADAFATLEVDIVAALTDFRNRFKATDKYKMPAGTRQIIPETVRLMTEATFDARKMGIY